MDARYFATWGLMQAVLAVSLGPFTEEVIYRGVLLPALGTAMGLGCGGAAIRKRVLADPPAQRDPDVPSPPSSTPAYIAARAPSGRRSFATRSTTSS